jgi:hypothetical protein
MGAAHVRAAVVRSSLSVVEPAVLDGTSRTVVVSVPSATEKVDVITAGS